MNIVPYNFIDAERLRFGKFPLLDTILLRWTRRMEDTLFARAHAEVYAGASMAEEMKFSSFFTMLRQPRPIYFFTLHPFKGTAILAVDNRFAAFCLRQGGSPGEEKRLRMSPQNQSQVQQAVQDLLGDFDKSWWGIHEVRSQLVKLTTIPSRARILNPYENCVVAQLHLSGRGLSSRMILCIPSRMLAPVAERLSHSKIIPAVGMEMEPGERMEKATVLEGVLYALQVRLGQLDLTDLTAPIKVGQVLPLVADSSQEALLELEGQPAMLGNVGHVDERIAFQIKRKHSSTPASPVVDPDRFHPLRWPEALGE